MIRRETTTEKNVFKLFWKLCQTSERKPQESKNLLLNCVNKKKSEGKQQRQRDIFQNQARNLKENNTYCLQKQDRASVES